MTRLFKGFIASITALGLMFGLTACAAPEDMTKVTAVIDVRTPEEFATGHLEGALNFDVQGMDFQTQISQLDPNGNYIVYCRSGNRSGQAIEQMKALGFKNLTNGGSVSNASTITRLKVVQ